MGAGIIKRLPGSLRKAGDSIPDVRRGGNAPQYRITDALTCAFAVFFFLYPSPLHFQRAMKVKRRRNNMETLFGVSEIPCDNKIRELTGGIEPGAVSGVFMDNLRTAEEAGRLRSSGYWTGVISFGTCPPDGVSPLTGETPAEAGFSPQNPARPPPPPG